MPDYCRMMIFRIKVRKPSFSPSSFIAIGVVMPLVLQGKNFIQIDHSIQIQSDRTQDDVQALALHSSSFFEITSTDYGFSNAEIGMNFSRRIITAEFFDALVQHPQYSKTAWIEVEKEPEKYPNRNLIAFLDVDSCNENNYPLYGVKWWKNEDTK